MRKLKADNRGVDWGTATDTHSVTVNLTPNTVVDYIGPGGQIARLNLGSWHTADDVVDNQPPHHHWALLFFLDRWRLYDLREVTRKLVQNKMGASIGKKWMLPEPTAEFEDRDVAIAYALLTYNA